MSYVEIESSSLVGDLKNKVSLNGSLQLNILATSEQSNFEEMGRALVVTKKLILFPELNFLSLSN